MTERYVHYGLPQSGPTTGRPAGADDGFVYFDETLGYAVVFDEVTNGWLPLAGVVAEERLISENGAGTYTAAFALPAGATILDVIVHGDVLWSAATSATLKVGDVADDDGIYTAVNLKATDLLAGESLSFAQSGGKAGAYNTGTDTHWTNRYSATARTINAIVTSVGAGTAGRTRVTVLWSRPRTRNATQA